MTIGGLRDPNWLTTARLRDLPPTLFFHARDRLAKGLLDGHFRLLNGLADHAAAQGLAIELVTFEKGAQDRAIAQGGHAHVFMDDRPVYALNAVHCVPSYLQGFWFFDEIGSRNNSLMRLAKFDPHRMVADYAADQHAKLYARFVETNKSKFEQAERGKKLRQGAICFFAQDFKPPRHHKHYMTVPEMIKAAIAAKGTRHLYIKPHPNQNLNELEQLGAFHDPARGVEVTQASIHDLLDSAQVVLTLSSAVGFEAFLHRKPVVLGGQTDFWQNAVTLTDPDRLAQAIEVAVGKTWPHEKFLVWYLKQMCVEDALWCLPRVLDRLYRKGFLWARADSGWY